MLLALCPRRLFATPTLALSRRQMAMATAAAASAGEPLRALIAPSMLSCDFARMGAEAASMEARGADWLHLDVMDGHFVPNLTFGAPIVKALRKETRAFLDCHLMVSEPEKWVDDFAAAGADGYTFHIEATADAGALIDRIVAKGMRPAIALKPGTPVEAVLPFAPRLAMVLAMTVEPGFGGQKFMPAMMDKVRALRAAHPRLNIQVDGGLTTDNVGDAAAAGANVIVAGTSIFGAADPEAAIRTMREAVAARLA